MILKKVSNFRLKRLLFHSKLVKNFSNYSSNEALLRKYIESPLPRLPQFSLYEPFWYSFWEQSNLFKPQTCDGSTKLGINDRFSMILPPPNVTGDLHLGHALTVAIQDAIFRYNKMMNKSMDCVWIPGFDHAGIATQLIVDKLCFASKGKRFNEMSKEEFIAAANEWKEQRIQSIKNQLKMLGASLDFSREYFTMNPRMSEAVNEAFIRLFEQGLIYRSEMMVNWSFYLKSTISDIEVNWEHIHKPKYLSVPGFNEKVEFGYLHKFAYPLIDGGNGQEIVVGTTRLESMLSDVAVAVHPNDHRYSNIIGRELLHPLTGHKLKVIADNRVDSNFCTGAVKITPTESEIDYAVAKDHNLEGLSSLDENGFVNCKNLKEDYCSINGLHRYSAKLKIIEILSQLGYYKGKVQHETKIPICSRSGDIIEKRILPQWFLSSRQVCEEINKLIKRNEIEIVPERQKGRLIEWIDKEMDWCISRQIMWGHRIPAFNVTSNGKDYGFVTAKNEEEALKKAVNKFGINPSSVLLSQDTDVLDTWFSSALLPFTVLGWPNVKSNDYKSFYPLNLMETGSDILNFWVLKMMMLGKCLTNQFPFQKILLHGMVCDANGRKMTKSLGNVIDPKDVINGVTFDELKTKTLEYKTMGILNESMIKGALENQKKLFPDGIVQCGADSLRMSLFQVKDESNEFLKLDVNKIIANRNYVNKMWQTFNFFNLMMDKKPNDHQWISSVDKLSTLSNMDEWILSRLSLFIESCHENLKTANFEAIHTSIHTFWIENLCDFYLESLKPTFYAQNKDNESISRCLNVLSLCLQTSLIAIHPFMPFVTEELYQRLKCSTNDGYKELKSILLDEYPKNKIWSKFRNIECEETMATIQEIIRNIRIIKQNFLATVDEEKELCINVVANPRFLPKITLFSDIFPKFTRSNISFINSEDPFVNTYQWIHMNINEDVSLRVKPNTRLISRKLEVTLQKQIRLKEKLKVFESKQKSKSKVKKTQEIKSELSILENEERELRRLLSSEDFNIEDENKISN